MKTNFKFNGYTCTEISVGAYASGRMALRLLTKDGEPLATATVNLDPPAPLGKTYIKSYAENEGLIEALVEQNLVILTGSRRVGHTEVIEVTPWPILQAEFAEKFPELATQPEKPLRATHLEVAPPLMVSLTNEPWFSDGYMNAEEPCPYSDGSDAENAWRMGAKFSRELGFEGATRAIAKKTLGKPLTMLEQTVFDKTGQVDSNISNAAQALESELPEAREFVQVLAATKTLKDYETKQGKEEPAKT